MEYLEPIESKKSFEDKLKDGEIIVFKKYRRIMKCGDKKILIEIYEKMEEK